jgi:hypothetical protein
MSIAAASPWAMRQPMSMSEDTAKAHASDAATNPKAPITNSRLRP